MWREGGSSFAMTPHIPLQFQRLCIASTPFRPSHIKRSLLTHSMAPISSIARTKSLDHLVLTVKDLDSTVEFYQKVMGMQHTTFASAGSPDVERHSLSFGTQKINLHVSGNEFEPKAHVGVRP